MNKDLELKDATYYSDLIYELKSLAGFEQQKNVETETRILERHKGIVVEMKDGPLRYMERLSAFQHELFDIIVEISRKSGINFRGLNEISKCPELVKDILTQLEIKKNTLEEKNRKVVSNDEVKLIKK